MDSASTPLILAQAAPDAIMQMAPLAMILAVFYFLLIRPQQQKAKEHDDFVKGLKRGEQVVTASGLYGRIAELRDHVGQSLHRLTSCIAALYVTVDSNQRFLSSSTKQSSDVFYQTGPAPQNVW